MISRQTSKRPIVHPVPVEDHKVAAFSTMNYPHIISPSPHGK